MMQFLRLLPLCVVFAVVFGGLGASAQTLNVPATQVPPMGSSGPAAGRLITDTSNANFSQIDVAGTSCTSALPFVLERWGVCREPGDANLVFLFGASFGASFSAIVIDGVGRPVGTIINIPCPTAQACSVELEYTNVAGDVRMATITKSAGTDDINAFVVSSKQDSGSSGSAITAQDRSKITDGLLNSFLTANGSIFEPNGVPSSVFGNGQVNGNGISFTPTGLASSASLAPNDSPASLFGFDQFGGQKNTFGDTTTNKGFNFSLDLNAMMRARAEAAEARVASLGAHKGSYKDAAPLPAPRLNAWASGRYVDFDDGQTNADRSGDLWWITSGLSYRVNERTTLGAFGRYKEGQVGSTALQSTLESDFYGGGAFAALNFLGGARLLLGGLYEHGDNDIVIQGASGTFDTDQWTVEGRIDKRFTRGRHWVEPQVKVRYTGVDRDAYTDSAGTLIASSDLSLGRLTYGPTFGTTITKPGGTEVKPFARINGIWDFENEGDFTLSTAAVFSSADTGLNLGGGVEVSFVRGFVLTLSGDWYTYDSELDAWSVQGGIGAPFAALGVGNAALAAGRVSLDFATTTENQTAKARVALPLN